MTDDMDARARVKRLEAENTRLRDALRQIKYHANAGHQDRPPWIRLGVISTTAEKALSAKSEPDRDPYNPSERDTTAFWMERAQRAEAECERLREALRELIDNRDPEGREVYLDRYRAVLQPPPPEGEPKNFSGCSVISQGEGVPVTTDASHTPEPTDDALTAAYFAGLERGKGVPQQAHGDALAELEFLETCAAQGTDGSMREAAIKSVSVIRRHLTASGVPYPINVVFDGPPGPTSGRFVEVETDDGRSIRVGEWIERKDGLWSLRIDCSGVPYIPEEVRRLPKDCRDRGRELSMFSSQYAQGGAYTAFLIADRIESALAAAPAVPRSTDVTCECGRGPREIFTVRDDTGHTEWKLATHCTECLEPAAAPTDGRE